MKTNEQLRKEILRLFNTEERNHDFIRFAVSNVPDSELAQKIVGLRELSITTIEWNEIDEGYFIELCKQFPEVKERFDSNRSYTPLNANFSKLHEDTLKSMMLESGIKKSSIKRFF